MKSFYTVLFLCVSFFLSAQDNDTSHVCSPICSHNFRISDSVDGLKKIEVFQYNAVYTERTKLELDTLIDGIRFFRPFEGISDLEINLGYFAAPALQLTSPIEYASDFFNASYMSHFVQGNNLPFYSTRYPFTLLYYSTGSFKEQQVSFLHTQNITKDFNLGVYLQYYTYQGEYARQENRGRKIAPWASYTGDMYSFHAYYAYNAINQHNNGGLLRDTLIRYPQSMIMNLDQASSQHVYQEGAIVQKWNLGSRPLVQDTLRVDLPKYRNALGHSLRYMNTHFVYHDSRLPESFYPAIYYTPQQTKDTLRVKTIRNTAFYESFFSKKQRGIVHLGLAHEYTQTAYADYAALFPKQLFNSFLYEGSVSFSALGFSVSNTHEYYIAGDRMSDYKIVQEIKKPFTVTNHAFSLGVAYKASQSQVLDVLQVYQSNHAQWNTQREPIFRQKISGELFSETGNISAAASLLQINNLLYFTQNYQLQQLNSRTFVTQLQVQKKTKLGQFYLDNSIIYQQTSSHALSLPQFVSYNSAYVSRKLFRNLIESTIGFDFLWFSEFNTPSYLPALGVFAYQDEISLGGYPLVNAFIAIKYKPIRVLLQYSGVYAELVEKNFLVPHYPQQSGAFSLAVSWFFFN